jgi:hypothetical protein
MGINYKGKQGQTKRAVVLQEGVCLLRGTNWVFIYNPGLNKNQRSAHTVYFVWISEQTVIIFLYSIN